MFCYGCDRGGQAPARRCKNRAADRRARACPSPRLDRENGVGRWTILAQVERSRGTGPRATVGGGRALARSGAGTPELQSPAPLLLIVIIL